MLYVRSDAVPPFVGSLMTVLVELPLFDGPCDVRLIPADLVP